MGSMSGCPHRFGSMPTILPVATPEVIRHPSGIPPGSRTARRLSSGHGGTGRTAGAAGYPGRRRVLFYDTLMRRRVDLPALARASAGLAECVAECRTLGHRAARQHSR